VCLKYKKQTIDCAVIDGLCTMYHRGMSKIKSISAFNKHYKNMYVEKMEQAMPVGIKNVWFRSDSAIRLHIVNYAQRF